VAAQGWANRFADTDHDAIPPRLAGIRIIQGNVENTLGRWPPSVGVRPYRLSSRRSVRVEGSAAGRNIRVPTFERSFIVPRPGRRHSPTVNSSRFFAVGALGVLAAVLTGCVSVSEPERAPGASSYERVTGEDTSWSVGATDLASNHLGHAVKIRVSRPWDATRAKLDGSGSGSAADSRLSSHRPYRWQDLDQRSRALVAATSRRAGCQIWVIRSPLWRAIR
jgi:hypothetical protein